MRCHQDQQHRYPCRYPDCEYGTNDRSRLNRHVKSVHQAIKSERCDVEGCDFATTTKSAIQKHKVNCHQPARFACPIDGCAQKFKWPFQLKSHMASHVSGSGPVGYTCKFPGCNFQYVQEMELRKHMDSVHADASIAMRQCLNVVKKIVNNDVAAAAHQQQYSLS